MALQVLVKEFVGYSALFLRTIEGKPTCPPIPQTRSIGKSLVTLHHYAVGQAYIITEMTDLTELTDRRTSRMIVRRIYVELQPSSRG